MTLTASQAIEQLKPQDWAKTPIKNRIALLKQVRSNLIEYAEALARADADMKNQMMGLELYGIPESTLNTAVPIANALTASIEMYEHLAKHGTMIAPITTEKLAENLFKVQVFPQTCKEKTMAMTQKGYLYLNSSKPTQVNPLDKPAGIIGVLGAGNYSSSIEMVKAMFFDNKAVVHKPHHNNEASDLIWEKIFQPLVDIGAIAFCAADQGQALTKDERLTAIYFTGGAGTAKAIASATNTPLISECGGNNPCLIVPSIRPWTDKEIEHQANQIATIAKLNGGAVCGRVQTVITSKHWSQRTQFLAALKKALTENTPAAGTYYQGSEQVWAGFAAAYPQAEILHPEHGKYADRDHDPTKFMLITDAGTDSYATSHEAFCQIISEVALEVANNAAEFLAEAVAFTNAQLLGTLGACILIDEDTKAKYQIELDNAIIDWHYGGIAINTMPPFIFLNPYLTWGGNEFREGQAFVSGQGNFGNLLGFEQVEKSVLEDAFMSMGHLINTNKSAYDSMAAGMTRFALNPSYTNIAKLMGSAVVGQFKKKDF